MRPRRPALRAVVAGESPAEVDDKPQVYFDASGDLSKACDLTLEHMAQCGVQIFQRANQLVKVVRSEDTRRPIRHVRRDPLAPRIVPLDEAALVDELTRGIQFLKLNRKTSQYQKCDCPQILAKTILSRQDWPTVPHLTSVVEHPVVLPDGRVLMEDGYHAETGLLIALELHGYLPVDDGLEEYDAYQALDRLQELLSGFAFESDLDLSVTVAFLLTFFVRAVLPTAPFFATTAHAAGSGKSHIARIGSRLASGRDPAVMVAPENLTELGKAVFAALCEGEEHIAVDNLEVPLQGAVWAVLATAPVYKDRILGFTKTAQVPTSAVVSVNGNNLSVVGDLSRRVLIASLDPACDRPAERVFAFDPLDEIDKSRAVYVHAALVLMCAYLRSGQRVDVRPFGSFELWSRMVREPLVWVGLPDPVDSIRALEAVDPERESLRVMLDVVQSVFGDCEFRSSELVAAAKASGRQSEIDSASHRVIHEEDRVRLVDALRMVCERNGDLNVKALGRWLQRMAGRYEGGRRFYKVRQAKDFACWRVGS